MINNINKKLKTKILNLPTNPGVYFFYDKNDQIIYIGKATVLKHRVGSYFRGAHFDYAQGRHDSKTEKLVSQIADIKYQTTNSVIEALILESNLIKQHQPKYNIREKDDKSFVQIAKTDEEYPRFLIIRPTEKKELDVKIKKYYGPYTSSGAVKEMLSIIRKIFTYRDCSSYKFNRYRKKLSPCLFYPLNLCPAPCVENISQAEYAKIVKQISDFLDGKSKKVITDLKKQMVTCSKAQKFEQAAKIRDQLQALEHINDVALIKQERSLEQLKNIPQRIEAYDISNLGKDYAVGSMVVFTGGEIDKAEYRKFRLRDTNLQINTNDANKKKYNANAQIDLYSTNRLPRSARNDGDKSPMSNSIRFENDNELRASLGDPQMIKQVITRRFNHPKWPQPDLLIIDGGKGQLSATLQALKTAKITGLPVIAVAKGPTRKGFALFKNAAAKNIVLDRKFIESIRDEAHRFAIKYHRQLKNKIK